MALLSACGQGTGGSAGQPRPSGGASSGENRAAVVESQATIPKEPRDEFADIATSSQGADQAWERFGLSGAAPEMDFTRSALVFIGLGESGSCPAVFEGLAAEDSRVSIILGTAGGPDCTADYNPRTFVIEVKRDRLPDGGFVLTTGAASFVLSSTTLRQPPADPSAVARRSSESIDLSLAAEPGSVPRGQAVEMALTNDRDVSVQTGAWPLVLQRWDEQRWLPAQDQPQHQSHPAIAADAVQVDPGETAIVATVATGALEPGWYSVYAKLQMAAEVQGDFRVLAEG